MPIKHGPRHFGRLHMSGVTLATAIELQGRSLAGFGSKRLDEKEVTHDLLAVIMYNVLVQQADHQPTTADTLLDQLTAEVHSEIEAWRQRLVARQKPAA
jgi:hypothetical protein